MVFSLYCSSVYDFFINIFSPSLSLSLFVTPPPPASLSFFVHPLPSPPLLISVGLPLSLSLRRHYRPPETSVPALMRIQCNQSVLSLSVTPQRRPSVPDQAPHQDLLHWGWQCGIAQTEPKSTETHILKQPKS